MTKDVLSPVLRPSFMISQISFTYKILTPPTSIEETERYELWKAIATHQNC